MSLSEWQRSLHQEKLQTCGLYVLHVRALNNVMYLRVMWRFVPWVTLGALTGVEETPCRGSLGHMLANGALVHPSQGGRYCAEGCVALGQ